MFRERILVIPKDKARENANARLGYVIGFLKKRNLRMSPKMKKRIKDNFYAHERFGDKLIPMKNILFDAIHYTKTSEDLSNYKSLEQKDEEGYFGVNWEQTKEPYENINYEGFETFEDFKKVLSVITDEEKLKKIFEEQKKKDKELQYPPLQLIKQNK